MNEIFSTFGVDWRLLLVQGINFGILLAGLTYFLYTPIMKMLEERREKVAQGVRDAQKAQEELAKIEQSRAATLAAAGKEADNVLANARASATQAQREIVGQAESTAASLLAQAQAQANEAKARAIAESKEEVAKLIVLGMERTLAQK